MLAHRLSSVSASQSSSLHAETACFSIQAEAEPTVMPRILELFAKRGLIPSRWHADLGGRRRDELTIDFQVEGLSQDRVEVIAHGIRQMVSVTNVLTSQKSFC